MQFLIPLLARILVPASRVLIYIFFGIFASIVWLLRFLKMDKLPEPIKTIFKVFFWGMLVTLPVFAAEYGSAYAITKSGLPSFWATIIYWFLVIALIEEVFKYLVVKSKALKIPSFDEPTDAMIYMIVAALGFAALENILYLLPPAEKIFSLNELLARTAVISFFRFIGATFLHALCSGLVGYFLAISLRKKNSGPILVFTGILLATLLHGLYNYSIMEIALPLKYIIPTIILLGLNLFIIIGFKKLRKMESICPVRSLKN